MVRMVPLDYSDVTYSHIVNQKQHEFKHRLMILDSEDYENKVNPKNYKFPKHNFDKISYYRDCSEVGFVRPTVDEINFLDDIIFLDFKVRLIEKEINENVFNFIHAFLVNEQPTKLLHLVNFNKPLIPSKWWNLFCKFFNDKKFEGVFIEIFNVMNWTEFSVDFDECVNLILELNLKNFIGVEYHHIYDNLNAEVLIVKNTEYKNIGKRIYYNPNANR